MHNTVTISVIALLILATSMVGCQSSQVNAERSPGELTFKKRCQNCHRLPNPDSKNDLQWPELVDRYGTKAGISDEEIALITQFLVDTN